MGVKKQSISFEESKQFSKLFIDYINAEPKLRSFYSYAPEIASFKQAIEDKSKESINRQMLTKVLKEQYTKAKLDLPSSVELLEKDNAFTVCTGHQLCLFTGPLYFIYKIISTINLAETLNRHYPDNHFIPIYWMASEDHDFEEIASVNLFGKKIKWESQSGGAVGRLNTASLHSAIDELKQLLGESENAKNLIQLFSDAYLNHANIAEATHYLVHQLFGQYGLLILNPDDYLLKNELEKFIKDDIFNNTNHKLVSTSISELEKIGVKPQVNPREINVFYMKDAIRERIEKVGDKYNVLNTEITFTKDELEEEIDLQCDRFSPNVVLRPLYQQYILPNLAYVGGPGEIAYWLEYKAMFNHHKINFPVLIPRNFALLSDEKAEQQLQKLGLSKTDIFKDTDLLTKEFVTKNAASTVSLKEQEDKLTVIYKELAEKVSAVDVTLKASVEAELQKSLGSLKNIENKLLKSEKQKQETSINQIKKLKDKFLPEGVLQERFENFAPYYLKHGKEFIAILKQEFNPFDYKILIIEL
jgi:bacillithiol biosynthesis cysteine-adding enzyme BshC